MDEKCSKTPSVKSETSQKLDTEDQNEIEKKKGLALLIYDLKQRKLIPIKILSLIVYSSYGVLFPYIAIHMKSLGISVKETGVIYSVCAVLGVFIPICVGIVADKLGNFKVLLSVLFACASVNSLLFLLVPVGRVSVDYPTNISMALECFDDYPNEYHLTTLTLTDLDLHPCTINLNKEDLKSSITNVSVTLDECGTVCYHREKSFEWSRNETDTSFLNEAILDFSSGKEFRDAVFFPNDWELEMICSQNLTEDGFCQLDRKSGTGSKRGKNATLGLNLFDATNNGTGIFAVKWMTLEDETEQKVSNFQCSSYGEKQKLLQTFQNKEMENNLQFCRSQCIVQVKRSELCSNMFHEEAVNPEFTFWMYFLLRLISDVFVMGSAILFDGAALALVSEVRGDFSFQRMFGFIGISIFSPISGALMDHFSANDDDKNFRPAFYLFAGLSGIAAFGMLTIDLNFKPPAENLMKNVISLLKNIELDVLLVVSLISGITQFGSGNFLFLFLEEIGGSVSLMGLSVTLSSLTAIPLLLLSDTIFRKFSIPNVIVFCLSIFVVRFMGYSFISNPNLCLFYESIEAISGVLILTSQMIYANQLGTISTVTSIQGLISATYYGLGGGIGNSVGSFLIGVYGQRVTFRIFAVIAFILGLFYSLFNIFYLRPIAMERMNCNAKTDLNVNEKVEEVRDSSSVISLC